MAAPLPPPHVVDTARCTAEVYDHGAQVTRWAPTGAEPVLWLSRTAVFEEGRSIRGGVPVCWPWFGPGRDGGMEPLHGFVRTSRWELVDRVEDGGDVVLTHRITDEVASSPRWPHSYELTLTARFGTALDLALTTTNTGTEPLDVEEALHAYLAVGDVRQVSVRGLEGASFFDKVTGTEQVQAGPLTVEGETDGVYRTTGPVTVDDPVLDRRLVITTGGCGNVVVWNPWADKAAEVADIGDEWPGFICVEGANAFENTVTVEPGGSHTATYRVEVAAR